LSLNELGRLEPLPAPTSQTKTFEGTVNDPKSLLGTGSKTTLVFTLPHGEEMLGVRGVPLETRSFANTGGFTVSDLNIEENLARHRLSTEFAGTMLHSSVHALSILVVISTVGFLAISIIERSAPKRLLKIAHFLREDGLGRS
jgi:hypothetical protein